MIGDTDTGFYFPAANSVSLVCGGVSVLAATSAGVTFPLGVTFAGNQTVTGDLTVNGNTTIGNAGIKSGLARQEKTIGKPPVEPVPKVPKAPKPPKEPCLFEDFYTLYPRKEAKQNALKAYQKAVKQVSHETIIEGVSKYKQQILQH